MAQASNSKKSRPFGSSAKGKPFGGSKADQREARIAREQWATPLTLPHEATYHPAKTEGGKDGFVCAACLGVGLWAIHAHAKDGKEYLLGERCARVLLDAELAVMSK